MIPEQRGRKRSLGKAKARSTKSEHALISGSVVAIFVAIALFGFCIFACWKLWNARNLTPPASIRLNVTATNIALRSTTEDVRRAVGTIDSSTVYVRNFARADLGPGSVQAPSKSSVGSSDLVLETSDPGSAIGVSDAALTGIDFPEGTTQARVSLQWDVSDPNALGLSVSPVESVRLSARVKREIHCDYCSLRAAGRPTAMDFQNFWFVSQDHLGHELQIVPREHALNLHLTLVAPSELRIREIAVRDLLQFQKMDGPRAIPSILSGEIHFPDFDDKRVEIPAASSFSIGHPEGFEIREIRIDKGLSLTGTGTVRTMTIAGTNALPSKLRVWMQTEPLSLYASMLGGAISALGAIGSLAYVLWAHKHQKQ